MLAVAYYIAPLLGVADRDLIVTVVRKFAFTDRAATSRTCLVKIGRLNGLPVAFERALLFNSN
jgi:hypothetical protein